MHDSSLQRIQRHPDYRRLIRQKNRLTLCMSLAVLGLYYGFTLLLAFAPGFMGRPFAGENISIGICLTVLVIILCFMLTALFVWQSNRLDPLLNRIHRECI